jgi:iron complex transport system substrate-binding protein
MKRTSGVIFGVLCLLELLAAQTTPRRIVSLVPSMTEVLFAIGAGDIVVGVSSYDKFPPEVENRPRVGALLDPDFERILSLKPDLVVVYGSQTDLIDRLRRTGIPTFVSRHAGLADVTASMRQLGERIGRKPQAEQVAAAIDRDLDEIRGRVAGRPRPKTALIFGREPGALRAIYASGGVGFMHDMLTLAGGDDVFADIKRENLQATAEVLLARAPEVIIEVHFANGWSAERIAQEQAVWNGLPALPAVRTKRVHVLVDDRLSTAGPRIAEGVRMLARTLHPGAFEK